MGYLAARPLKDPPGTRSVYSCLGYIVLARVLEAAGGARLDELFAGRVARPLGLRETGFLPPASARPRIAPTERGNLRERELAAGGAEADAGWPEGILRGEVHDRNSRHLGGLGGNAGLFGTALEVERLARTFLVPGFLPEEALAAARSPVEPREPQVRTLGFQSALSPGSAAGEALSASSFGHTGFTGTSVFIDPEAGRTLVLLTNRVHPRWRSASMDPLRRAFHALAASALGEQGL
jgi:CubicO group peptidase (beta-lactamase class C family)